MWPAYQWSRTLNLARVSRVWGVADCEDPVWRHQRPELLNGFSWIQWRGHHSVLRGNAKVLRDCYRWSPPDHRLNNCSVSASKSKTRVWTRVCICLRSDQRRNLAVSRSDRPVYSVLRGQRTIFFLECMLLVKRSPSRCPTWLDTNNQRCSSKFTSAVCRISGKSTSCHAGKNWPRMSSKPKNKNE